MAVRRPRKSAFVPRLLVRTAIVGVIPACATACGSGEGSSTQATDAGGDVRFIGVAVAYPVNEAGGFDGVAGIAYPDGGGPDVGLGVADIAYPPPEAGAPDAPGDASTPDASPDVFRGPLPLAVTAYEVDPPKRG
jgi:hypothetical protein